jgi:hypothetical protein
MDWLEQGLKIWFAGMVSVFFVYFSAILLSTTSQLLKIIFYFSTSVKLWKLYIYLLVMSFFKGLLRVSIYWIVDFWRVQEQVPLLYQRTKMSFTVSALAFSPKGRQDVELYFKKLGVDQGEMQKVLFQYLEMSLQKIDRKRSKKNRNQTSNESKIPDVSKTLNMPKNMSQDSSNPPLNDLISEFHQEDLIEIKGNQMAISKLKPEQNQSGQNQSGQNQSGQPEISIQNWDDLDRRRIQIQKALEHELTKRGLPMQDPNHIQSTNQASIENEASKIKPASPVHQTLDQKKANSLYLKNKK